jgi:hypothetical protein
MAQEQVLSAKPAGLRPVERRTDTLEPDDQVALVDDLLAELDDRHSAFLRPQRGERGDVPSRLAEDATPSGGVSDGIGHIELPGMSFGPDNDPGLAYASAARRVLGDDPCGWVVDLRGNIGGDMGGDLATMSTAG